MHIKHLPVTVEKSESEAFDARFVMSAATPDRVKDTIEPSAYKSVVNNTRKLIALWQHDPDRPIGTWENLKAEGDRLTGYIKFASTSLAQMAKTLIADGVPLGASIGFRGSGEPNKTGGIHFKSIELLECSVVSIPAHPRAMQIAKSFGVSLTPETSASSTAGSSDEERDAVLKRAVAARENALNSINSKQEYSNEAL
jgi:HK97 family phage prohead protease